MNNQPNNNSKGSEKGAKTFAPEELRRVAPGLGAYTDAQIEAMARKLTEIDRSRAQEAQRRGIRRKIESGEGYGCAPVGYVNKRKGDRSWIEVDPVKGPLVREAFELHATGNYSLRQLCAVMAEKGLRSRNGHAIGASGLSWMLKNEYYLGILRSFGKQVAAIHPALVDRATFQAANSGRPKTVRI